MAGLLYKDFVASRGKLFLVALSLLLLLAGGAAVFPASEDTVLIVSAIIMMSATLLPMVVIGGLETSIISVDAGAGKKAWILSLPIDRKQYVASKYLYVLICYFVVLSVIMLCAILVEGKIEAVISADFISDAMGLVPLWVQACMLVSALELPFFIAVGVKAGTFVKTGILFVVMFWLFGFMLFGDISILERWNLSMAVDYFKEHKEFFACIRAVSPVLAGLLYYCSYRISVVLYREKEFEDE